MGKEIVGSGYNYFTICVGETLFRNFACHLPANVRRMFEKVNFFSWVPLSPFDYAQGDDPRVMLSEVETCNQLKIAEGIKQGVNLPMTFAIL